MKSAADEVVVISPRQRDSDSRTKRALQAERWDGLLCSALFLLSALASRPFVEMGLIDDFSYVRTAFVFARTGHLVYNGWATAMLGAQIVWAAPFIKLLGYSFFATRVSTLVTATLCVWLTHAVMRRVGLNRAHAVLGTLTLGLSPLFVPMSISFMTDISGLFAIVAALYCCLRALESATARGAVLWLALGDLVGLLGGTTRQIAWVTVLVLTPSAAWLLRRRRGVLLTGAALWLLSVAFIAGCMLWFKHQPYNVPEPIIQGSVRLRTLRELAGTTLAAALCLAFVSIPELATALPRLRSFRPRVLLGLFVASLVTTAVCDFITHHLSEHGLVPWTGDVIDKIGLFEVPNAWMLGVPPLAFNTISRAILSVGVVFLLITFLYVIARSRSTSESRARRDPFWLTLAQLLGPFSLAYCALLLPRAIWTVIIDRYLLPLIVIAGIVLLRLHQEGIAAKVPRISWLVLAGLSGFSVMGTHDWIASHRARLAAVQRIERAGVPATKIEAGYEFDGTTQIDAYGVVYDPRVSYPAGMNIHPYEPPDISEDCKYLFNPHTPAVHAEYFLAYQQVPCLEPSSFGAVDYGAWLPPFHREILILKRSR